MFCMKVIIIALFLFVNDFFVKIFSEKKMEINFSFPIDLLWKKEYSHAIAFKKYRKRRWKTWQVIILVSKIKTCVVVECVTSGHFMWLVYQHVLFCIPEGYLIGIFKPFARELLRRSRVFYCPGICLRQPWDHKEPKKEK